MFEAPRLLVKRWLSRCSRRVIGPHACGVAVRTERHVLLVDPADFGVGRHLRFNGRYAEGELARLRPLVGDADDVLVVGGHVGALALPLSEHCRRLDVIEANPRSLELLRHNVRLNARDNITVHGIAAGDRDGDINFLAATANSGGSKIAPRRVGFRYRFDAPQTVRVPMCRLDDHLGRRTYGLIVMDIEGAETLAMAGMPRLLERCRHLAVEFVPHHLDDVAGVGVDDFFRPLAGFPHVRFSDDDDVVYEPDDAINKLRDLHRRRRSDDGILFSRTLDTVVRRAA